MLSVTLDSNIYVSALNFKGNPLHILNLARDGKIRLDVSEAIFEEFSGVLRDKFRWSEDDIADVEQKIRSFANLVTPAESLTVVARDADDDRIVECAAAARSDYIVTGDKDLLELERFRGTRIIKPAEFLEMSRGR